jgi:glutamine---fructose-6-phosphate transaminase (isomerizing)
MCGIVGYIGPRKAIPLILDGLKRLEYRGYDSAGIAVVDQSGMTDIRRASGKLCNLEESSRQSPIEGSCRGLRSYFESFANRRAAFAIT